MSDKFDISNYDFSDSWLMSISISYLVIEIEIEAKNLNLNNLGFDLNYNKLKFVISNISEIKISIDIPNTTSTDNDICSVNKLDIIEKKSNFCINILLEYGDILVVCGSVEIEEFR